jgi:hypothetical protein
MQVVHAKSQNGHLETMETNKDQIDESNQALGKEIQGLGMGELKEGLLALGQ